MLSYAKSATARPGDRLNGFENGKTQLFNSWGVGKSAYFQKKWSVPLRYLVLFPVEKIKLSEFCLKQVKLSASGVSKIFLKQEYFTYPTGR